MATMECPRCWKPLDEQARDVFGPDVTVDACPACQGEFLDEGEIKRLTGDRDLHKLLTEYLGSDADSDLVCPGCGDVMDAEALTLESGTVEVDVCLGCRGVWLDDGELAKLEETGTDFGDLDDEKLAEIWDQRVAEKRRKGLLGRLLGGLRGR